MVVGLAVLAFAIWKVVKFLYNVFFGKVVIDQSGYEEGWFGKGSKPNDVTSADTSIRPFKINIPDDVLADLKDRLQKSRYQSPLEGSKFTYGFNSDYLQTVVEYWKSEYDWRKHEEQLNHFPHFKTCIEGIDIHFVHVKPTLPEGSQLKVIPLLIVHGWPGSFYEFYKMIPLLTTPTAERNFIFEVICPSIPGYGFSEASHQKGCDARATARIFLTLMERLGHNRFYVQGGDWGSFIASILGKYYPNRMLGVHLNMFTTFPKSWDLLKAVVVAYFPSLVSKTEYEAFFPFWKKVKMLLEESGYLHLQSTKPDTLGSGITNSPVGLAAYILEKFSTWVHVDNRLAEDGNLTEKFTLDELLTNVMIYWVNNNFTSSARFYKENITKREHEKLPLTVPTGLALFPNEIMGIPKCLLGQNVKQLVSYSIMPRGGHFAAFEEPQLLADDVWKFVSLAEKTSF